MHTTREIDDPRADDPFSMRWRGVKDDESMMTNRVMHGAILPEDLRLLDHRALRSGCSCERWSSMSKNGRQRLGQTTQRVADGAQAPARDAQERES
jgi:hypothetical protein